MFGIFTTMFGAEQTQYVHKTNKQNRLVAYISLVLILHARLTKF
jgi:hypothetical protein